MLLRRQSGRKIRNVHGEVHSLLLYNLPL
jgi:hypothetical protein